MITAQEIKLHSFSFYNAVNAAAKVSLLTEDKVILSEIEEKSVREKIAPKRIFLLLFRGEIIDSHVNSSNLKSFSVEV